MIKGVFFDLGGTLYSYRNIGTSTVSLLSEFAGRHQLSKGVDTLLEHYQAASKKTDQVYAEQNFYLFRDYFKTIYGNMVSLADLPHLADDVSWFCDTQVDTYVRNLELKEECHQALSALRSKNLYLSIVSNIDEEMLHPLVDRGQLHQWLDHWTSSEAAQSCKPDPRFFDIALEKSGLAPENVLFVGDSLEQDIQGAHNAGMNTVLITEGISDGAPMHVGRETVEPDYRINRLDQLVEIIENLR